MIREVTMYRVFCDEADCGAEVDDEFYAWADGSQAISEAQDCGWYTADGDRCLCPAHIPKCAAGECGVRLHSDEFGPFCEDHDPVAEES